MDGGRKLHRVGLPADNACRAARGSPLSAILVRHRLEPFAPSNSCISIRIVRALSAAVWVAASATHGQTELAALRQRQRGRGVADLGARH